MPPKQISKKRHIGGQTYPAIGSRRTKPPRPSVRGARAGVTVKKKPKKPQFWWGPWN